ncbi:uncharacterized protein A4U43_C10F14080 [Asparagus officinalis]|uniref:Pentacotripeptide-repeat region of PRORP domain-containing protein n=1 Tax=Asparagus officinalis TaxID=4686 RepID=A0A5P1E2X9_ASPOF|nr:uncharacterized protein A4U43_C10F14080 [Asparagus officinalis]
MFNAARFCRQHFQIKHPVRSFLSSACQLFDEIPSRENLFEFTDSALGTQKQSGYGISQSCKACSPCHQFHCRIRYSYRKANTFPGHKMLEKEAFLLFKSMRVAGYVCDEFTFSSLLSSCSSLQCKSFGKQTHGLVIKLASDSDTFVTTAIIDMYMKCGCIEDARKAFNIASKRSTVLWNAMIIGYGQNGDGKEAMKLLSQMIRGGQKPDELTLSSVLSSSADSAMANEAAQLHNYVMKNGFWSFLSIGNALIVAYAKIGRIYNALRVFHSICKPDLVSWTSMVTSYAYHGLAIEAIDTFERMIREGINPDKIAFLGVLSACCHAGLLEKGLHHFASMKDGYQIEPSLEHYTCLVDLLGRKGQLSEAYKVIINMPFEPNGDILRAFLGACKVHGDIGKAKWAADRILSVEANEAANYKIMSNMYAGLGSWGDVARLRKMMRDRCGEKAIGCSRIENGGRVHTFVSNDESHPQSSEICCMLRMLLRVMKDADL